MKSKKVLFLTVLVVVGCVWHWNNARLVSLRLPAAEGESMVMLPNKDKKRLNFFFRELLLKDGGIYTLVGDKPMSFGAYSKPFASFRVLDLYHACLPDNLRMYWSWKTYLKYQHLFYSQKFRLWAEPSPLFVGGGMILFMVRNAAATVVKRYERDFCDVLNEESVNLEWLLSESEHRPLFSGVLKGHEGLIGTLLGYGRENAWLFWKRSLGESVVLASPWEADEEARMKVFAKLCLSSLFGKECEDITEEVLEPPFVADVHSEETRQIKEQYLLTTQRIKEIYRGNNFLETTLGLLVGENEQSQCAQVATAEPLRF